MGEGVIRIDTYPLWALGHVSPYTPSENTAARRCRQLAGGYRPSEYRVPRMKKRQTLTHTQEIKVLSS